MFMQGWWIAVIILILLVLVSLKTLREYQRGVVFLLGRFDKVKGPGLIIIIPVIQQMVRVDLRTIVMDVPSQDVISRDNVSVKVNAVVYFRVLDPELAIIQVENYYAAISQLAQTTLRSVLGQHELDEMLAEREKLNADVQAILDEQTNAWGIKVSNVEIKHVDLDESMIRAIAKQAEAERIMLSSRSTCLISTLETKHVDLDESMIRAIAKQAEAERVRRAKVIHAEGEFQASMKLVDAAEQLARQPQAITLRYLQTLTDIAGDKSSTIVFPLPVDLLRSLAANAKASEKGES